jgi:ABC-2 type transport system permease protein
VNGLATLARRLLVEARWLMLLSAAAMFALSWLCVYRNSVMEARLRADTTGLSMRARMILRTAGGPNMDFSAAAIEALVFYWFFLCIPILITVAWAIARGAASVAGEIERGTMDLVLSRPVARTTFLGAQVLVALAGFLAMGLAIVVGHAVGVRLHPLEAPPPWLSVLRPILNLDLLGVSVLGYTVMLSAVDSVRWRPTLISSGLTLVQFGALAVANQPDWDSWRWLNHVTIFSAFQPIEAAVVGEALFFNGALLGGIGLAGVVLGWIAFQYRDLPANS